MCMVCWTTDVGPSWLNDVEPKSFVDVGTTIDCYLGNTLVDSGKEDNWLTRAFGFARYIKRRTTLSEIISRTI